MQAIADAEIATTPSFAEGQINLPRSSRLAKSDMPTPSCHKILHSDPLRPRKTYRSPACTSWFRPCCTCSAKDRMPFRMSVWPIAIHIRALEEIGIIAAATAAPPPPASAMHSPICAPRRCSAPRQPRIRMAQTVQAEPQAAQNQSRLQASAGASDKSAPAAGRLALQSRQCSRRAAISPLPAPASALPSISVGAPRPTLSSPDPSHRLLHRCKHQRLHRCHLRLSDQSRKAAPNGGVRFRRRSAMRPR